MKPSDEAHIIVHLWPGPYEDDVRAFARKAWEAGYNRAEYDWRISGQELPWAPETFDEWWDSEQ